MPLVADENCNVIWPIVVDDAFKEPDVKVWPPVTSSKDPVIETEVGLAWTALFNAIYHKSRWSLP